MYEIRPWLSVGKYAETVERTLLEAYDITAMLQLAAPMHQPGIERLTLLVNDGEALPLDKLKQGIEFVLEQKAADNKVLVACGAGISRSSTFAIAALKEAENLDLETALREVAMQHPRCAPHPELWASLCAYYKVEISPVREFDILNEIRRRYHDE